MASLPVKQCVLPTFLITSRKNRRNLFPSFLHDTQTAGAVGSAGHSWERAEVLRAIRQQGTAVEWGHAQAQWQHWAAPHGSLLLVLLARLGDVGFVTSVQHRCSGHLVALCILKRSISPVPIARFGEAPPKEEGYQP